MLVNRDSEYDQYITDNDDSMIMLTPVELIIITIQFFEISRVRRKHKL